MNKIRVLSLFSGIGAFEKALTRQGISYELVNYCEIDKYASKAYSLIHNVSEDKNLGDITKVNPREIADFDLMTWGFPCTDISIAGKQKGLIDKEGNKTRSGLYYDGLRILQTKKPKYSIIENVKALTQKKFKQQFEQILYDLDVAGYNSYWAILNAKDFGVPQNRERVFIISIRKDCSHKTFEFPLGFDNGIRLKDILEQVVDEKYFLSNKTIELIKRHNVNLDSIDGITQTALDASYYKGIGVRCGKVRCCFEVPYPQQIISVGQVSNNGSQAGKVYDPKGIFPTVCACTHGYAIGNIIDDKINDIIYKVRRLTPLECFRIMGFNDEDCGVLKSNKISDTQLYKMAGNSIVVNVLEGIFKNLLSAYSINKEEQPQYIVS